jgi:hypothetical protein
MLVSTSPIGREGLSYTSIVFCPDGGECFLECEWTIGKLTAGDCPLDLGAHLSL